MRRLHIHAFRVPATIVAIALYVLAITAGPAGASIRKMSEATS